MSPLLIFVRTGSNTCGLEIPKPVIPEVLDRTCTVNVKLLPLSRRNSRSIAPLELLAGVPPVATMLAVPIVRVMINWLLTACDELPNRLLTVVALV